jgi:hypothetical protein
MCRAARHLPGRKRFLSRFPVNSRTPTNRAIEVGSGTVGAVPRILASAEKLVRLLVVVKISWISNEYTGQDRPPVRLARQE